MIGKIMLSDKDYEYLTKGIAIGIGAGTIIGMIVKNITLGFAAGGVVGIIVSSIYSYHKKSKKNKGE